MLIPDDVLARLICPVCKAPIHFLPDKTGMKCDTCKRVYPVRDEILVLLPEEATMASE